MTKKEFKQELENIANVAVQRANKFLEQLDLSLNVDWEYDDWSYNDLDNAIGVYEGGSVFGGDISIGFNINNLYKWFGKEIKRHPWSDGYTILDEAIQTNVFHEMGHGIIELFNDYLQETDDLDELYDNNQQLFDNVLDNEEDSVEEFAWAMYDNQLEDSKLYNIIQLYLEWGNTQSNNLTERLTRRVISLFEDKIGGLNYANKGDEFYTQERDIVKELSNYDLRGKIIYCNCDNPTMSNFYKFFKNNFNNLGLKFLYASYFDKNPKMFFFNGSQEKSMPISSGRFQDNAEIMKRCDIVITNPPFSNSMASELIKMAKSYGKHVIMVGPSTIANQKEMFELIKNGQLNMGYTSVNRFNMPDGSKKTAPTAWWTTMDTKKPMFKTGIKYNPSNYQKYDNFDAIDIKDYREIPDDYYGYMGVSPKFLRALNRDQFEIVNKIRPRINGKVGFEKYIIRRKSQQQANKLNENLFTHDDEYNIYEKLDELDITYDFINDRENIIEIDIPDETTRKKVSQILNYYGWKNIKETKYSICAERIYGDKWNDFYDEEAEDDDDEGYPFGVGIYYHITTSNKVPKILKQGLTVREGNKLGYARGERIYLISYPNKFLAHDLCRHMTGKINITILLVDIRKYLGKQINIYHDDFTADEGAVYTYDYIPPQCIKVYDNFIVDKKSQPQAVAESLTNGIFKNFKLMID